ncbi:MAG: dihydropteroate synthase [Arenicellales bacterium]|nr:dihydropteroate synthase [Arenicellales bacterium]
MQPSPTAAHRHLQCGDRSLSLAHTVIVGILNVTPDSFSDGGRFEDKSVALKHAESMQQQGAEVIDVGGESTRPGALKISVDQELDRVIPIIEALRTNIDVVISVDTSKPEVMQTAIAAGAGMINDVNALRSDSAVTVAAKSNASVCLMHMLGEPRTMQINPEYGDVVVEVRDYLLSRAQTCVDGGIDMQRIVIDPGFGFGKTVDHNLELLRNLNKFGNDYPVMVGLSRKSMIGKLLGLPMDARVHASVALALVAVNNGARLVRVHDVGPTRDAIRMYEAIYEKKLGSDHSFS